MLNDEPSVKEMAALWTVCYNFIKDQHISCEETVCEDRVYENAPDLVHEIAEIVGYYEYPEDE
jgi:hypothetical protein